MEKCRKNLVSWLRWFYGNYYNKLAKEVKVQFLEQLLYAVQLEVTANLRRKICEVVAEAARNLIDSYGCNQWPDLLQFLFQCANSPSATHQETALKIMALVPRILGNQPEIYMDLIKQLLENSLNPLADSEVQIQAVPAFVALIIFHNINTSIQVEDQWRHLVLEVMVSVFENIAPMVRKTAEKYIITLIPLILEMMTDFNDWDVLNVVVLHEKSNNTFYRLVCGLGGKTILPRIISTIPSMLSDINWKQRHAALMAIIAISEGCYKEMAMLDDIMEYVKCATCTAIGEMSINYAPIFEKKFPEEVIFGVLCLLDGVENVRVQAHAGSALENFIAGCPRQILTCYLIRIMNILEDIVNFKFKQLVENSDKLVLKQASCF